MLKKISCVAGLTLLLAGCGSGSSDTSPLAFSFDAAQSHISERETLTISYQLKHPIEGDYAISTDKGWIDSQSQQVHWDAYEVERDTRESITVTISNSSDSYSKRFDFEVLDTDYVFYFSDPDVPNQDYWDDRYYAAPNVNAAYLEGLVDVTAPIRIAMAEIGVQQHQDLPTLAGSFPNDGRNHYHGTMVGSVMTATQDNAEGLAGMVSNASLYRIDYNAQGWAQYLLDNQVSVLNISRQGVVCEKTGARWLQREIDTYIAGGGIIAVSAGNDSTTTVQDCANIILVASVDRDGTPSSFSNFGERVDLSAIGQDLLLANNRSYQYAQGTSFSAPQVAAALALAKQRFPQLNHDIALLGLTQSSKPFIDPEHYGLYGAGILDVKALLQWLALYYAEA